MCFLMTHDPLFAAQSRWITSIDFLPIGDLTPDADMALSYRWPQSASKSKKIPNCGSKNFGIDRGISTSKLENPFHFN